MAKRGKGKPTDFNRVVAAGIVSSVRRGDSVEKIAKDFGINKDSFYTWQEKHKDFAESVAKARDYFFRNGVEQGLVDLIRGVETTTTRTYERRNNDTGEMEVKGVETTAIKHPPDWRAIRFTLHNRYRNKWNKPMATQLDLTKLPLSHLIELSKECLADLEAREEEGDD